MVSALFPRVYVIVLAGLKAEYKASTHNTSIGNLALLRAW